jgi:hypothetical protein
LSAEGPDLMVRSVATSFETAGSAGLLRTRLP